MMDLKIKMSLFALVMLGALLKVSAQSIDCYSCSYTYVDGEVESDSQDCKNPTAALTSTTSCSTSSSSCYVRSVITSSSSVSSPGSITYTRGCGNTDSCDADCLKDPRDCRKCCTTGSCNTGTFAAHISDNALTQTCYRCQYSEVPGTRSDTGCGLTFDGASSRVYEVECPGLCFSAKAKFEDVEDIIRGCLYHGNQCSYEGIRQNDVPGYVVNGRDNVNYDLACCTGDKCNTATTISVGVLAVLFSTLLGAVMTHL